MIGELETLTALGSELCRRARGLGVFLVWRAQDRQVLRVLVRRGKVEESTSATFSGNGVHVFDPEGGNALASRDDFREEHALGLLDRACHLAAKGPLLGTARLDWPELTPTSGRDLPADAGAFASTDPDAVGQRLVDLERDLAGGFPALALRVSFQSDLDAWRVMRSDGTDVLFAMPRCVLRFAASAEGAGATHTVHTSIQAASPERLFQEAEIQRFLARAHQSARLAASLPDAPVHPAGCFPLVIDYALAKGLAHEAFGHASEADGFRSSVLADRGRFRTGAVVGASHVSIVDEPVRGDVAWQPFSASGVPRQRIAIVDHGKLAHALTDPWSAGRAGTRLTGADRAESFRDAPLPRMTNIRIEVDGPEPAPGAFEDYGPHEVRDLLARSGVFRRHRRVVFLSGYSGGQTNPATGDFVFNCKAIYDLGEDGVVFHKPAIFSGSMFGALGAVREAFGPLCLDASGTCGKWGQNVPSSGGSHYFLVLDSDPTVRLGGR